MKLRLLTLAILALAPRASCRGPPSSWGKRGAGGRHLASPVPDHRTAQRALLDALKIRPSGSDRPAAPPRHMVELYEGLVSGRREIAAASEDAVVRSIAPLPETHRKNMLVFNMSSLFPNEDVFTAHLHLRRRRMVRQSSTRHQRRMRKTLEPPMHVRLLRLNLHSHRRPINIASYPVARGERGWRVLDVTAAVRESAAMPGTSKQTYLGIRFEEPTRTERRRARRFVTVPIKDFLLARCETENVAYLVLYSKETEDNSNMEEEQVDYREPTPSKGEIVFWKMEYGPGNDNELKVMVTDDFEQPRKSPTSSNYLDAGYDANSNKILEPNASPMRTNQSSSGKLSGPDSQPRKGERKQRKGRDISNNELPGDGDGPMGGSGSIYATFPTVIFSSHVGEETNGTGLTAQLEVYLKQSMPLRSSSPVDSQVLWKEAEVRRQREGLWEEVEASKGEVDGARAALEEATAKQETGAGSDGAGSADVETEGGSIANGKGADGKGADAKGQEVSRTEYQELPKAPRRDRVTAEADAGVSGKGSRRKSRGHSKDDPWRNFGEVNSSRRKGIRYQLAEGRLLREERLDVAGGGPGGAGGRALAPGNCSLRSYAIDFHDLGWNWLYGPRIFQSAVCTGLCPNPNIKDLYITKHARIQNLLSALRGRDGRKYQPETFAMDWDVTASFLKNRRDLLRPHSHDPCCAPNMLAPLILLYADENEEFVLRLFPSLKVISCACI